MTSEKNAQKRFNFYEGEKRSEKERKNRFINNASFYISTYSIGL